MAPVEVKRRRRPAEVAELLEPHEPFSTFLVADLKGGSSSLKAKAWTFTREDELAAALVIAQPCPTRWYAAPFFFGEPVEEVARAVAGVIDGSSAWNVTGPAPYAMPVYPHLRRRRYAVDVLFLHQEPPLQQLQEADPESRLARPEDIDGVVDLYNGFEHIAFVPTVKWLRQMFERLIARDRVVVIEQDGRIAGGVYLDKLTRRYAYWTGLTVHPDFRGRGLSWKVIARANEITIPMGVGYMGVINPTNPMKLKEREPWSTERDRWVWARLQAPHRYPGHWRLRKWWVDLNGPRTSPRRHEGPLRDDVGWIGAEATEPTDVEEGG